MTSITKSHLEEVSVKIDYYKNHNKGSTASKMIEKLETLFESHEHKRERYASRPHVVAEPPKPEDMQFNKLYTILERWNPDDPDIPKTFKETLQNFNYGDPYERSLAVKYRDAEVPFKIHNVSEVDAITRLWTDDYLIESTLKMKEKGKGNVEKSANNHFLYWRYGTKMSNYEPPTERVNDMNFEEWLRLARDSTVKRLRRNEPHYYYMVSAFQNQWQNNFVGRDLNMFTTTTENFFITNVKEVKTINCRFGMRGIIAESHFDGDKNMIAIYRGNKRYVLSPPNECPYFALITDAKHPSYRQSVIDWSDLQQAKSHHFDKVNAIDTVVHEGEVLYIPSYWFHYVISLDYSIQCNARSGTVPSSLPDKLEIEKCLGLSKSN